MVCLGLCHPSHRTKLVYKSPWMDDYPPWVHHPSFHHATYEISTGSWLRYQSVWKIMDWKSVRMITPNRMEKKKCPKPPDGPADRSDTAWVSPIRRVCIQQWWHDIPINHANAVLSQMSLPFFGLFLDVQATRKCIYGYGSVPQIMAVFETQCHKPSPKSQINWVIPLPSPFFGRASLLLALPLDSDMLWLVAHFWSQLFSDGAKLALADAKLALVWHGKVGLQSKNHEMSTWETGSLVWSAKWFQTSSSWTVHSNNAEKLEDEIL